MIKADNKKHMKRIIYSLLISLTACGVAHALQLRVSPGKFFEQIPAIESTTDKMLVLNGSANASDLLLLSKLSRSVETLDMSGLTVEAFVFPDEMTTGKKVYVDGELPAYMLAGTGIKNVMLPENTIEIGEGAFSSSGLNSINIPQTVSKIGNYAFASCTDLTNATLASDTQLGIGLFKDCTALKTVKFEYPVAYIPASMFDGCVMYSQEIPSSVRTIGDYAFRKTALKTLNLSHISEIGEYAFADMPDLVSVSFSEAGAINLGSGAFFNDRGLETLPAFMSELPKLAMAQTIGKSEVVIRSSVIGEAAYANNPNLDTLTLGAEVRTIEKNAFRNLKGLKLVDVCRLKSNVPEVDEDAFSGLLSDSGSYDIGLNVVKGTESAWKAHPVWSLFKIGQYETGIDTPAYPDESDIKVSRDKSAARVSSMSEIDFIGIYSVDGTLLYEDSPGATDVTITDLPISEILIFKVKSGSTVKVVKLR